MQTIFNKLNMLQFSKLKLFSILFLCIISVYFSIPTIFPDINKKSTLFSANKVNLGLDLKGGVSLLLDVDTEQYIKDRLSNQLDHIKRKLKKEKNINLINTEITSQGIIFHKAQLSDLKLPAELVKEFDIVQNDTNVTLQVKELELKNTKDNVLNQTLEIIRKRIDGAGTKEVDLQKQGENSILLQVPGLHDPKQLKRILGKTAKLSFHIVDTSVNIREALNGKITIGTYILPTAEDENKFIAIKSRAVLTGDMLTNAQSSVHNSAPVVNFQLNNIGGQIFADISTKNRGKMLAIVLDNKIISAPRLQEPILSGSGTISGNFSIKSASELALLLRAGALPAPIKIVEERSVGPSLGSDSIDSGTTAIVIGLVMVVITMILFYGLFGIIANIALVMNFFFLISLLTLFEATLTLPGIAGMVLTLGMAVDANVLIYERIKEEFKKGRTVLSSIESGYKLAFVTIMDSNITTIVAAIILYALGNGPVKGFAVTLSMGIICSLFTSITLTKLAVAYWYKKKKPNSLPI